MSSLLCFLDLRRHQRACGVVVSHPLSMREALGSIPSVSNTSRFGPVAHVQELICATGPVKAAQGEATMHARVPECWWLALVAGWLATCLPGPTAVPSCWASLRLLPAGNQSYTSCTCVQGAQVTRRCQVGRVPWRLERAASDVEVASLLKGTWCSGITPA